MLQVLTYVLPRVVQSYINILTYNFYFSLRQYYTVFRVFGFIYGNFRKIQFLNEKQLSLFIRVKINIVKNANSIIMANITRHFHKIQASGLTHRLEVKFKFSLSLARSLRASKN